LQNRGYFLDKTRKYVAFGEMITGKAWSYKMIFLRFNLDTDYTKTKWNTLEYNQAR
jgi:hypothetical protein